MGVVVRRERRPASPPRHGLMQRLPFRRLIAGPPPDADRVFYTNLWFRGHNNPRYAELLPRLSRLDPYLFVCSDRRIPRGFEYRVLRWTRKARDPLLFAAAKRRYGSMFTTDNEQIRYFSGTIVTDVDDPRYTPEHVALLNRPNVAAYVVTAQRAADRFEELGVRKPYHVIPQGVSLGSVSADDVAEVAARHRRNGEVVVGYMAAWLLTADDRGGENPLYNVDHLLELWQELSARLPSSRLWLIGGASERLQSLLAARDDVALFGRLPRDRVLAYVANFDIALYPRTQDQGIQAAKVAEYMGLGVPTVSYDFRVTEVLRETGAGVLVSTPREFIDAVEHLALDEPARTAVAAAARTAGAALDWDVLARRYETEILDRYLRA
jgi:glycosyltransferase involved in cell wall biosynthesis